MVITQYTLDALETRCQEETARFFARAQSDTRYCFELLRRALETCEADAFARVYNIYQPMCARWVLGFSGFRASGEESPDVFVNIGFAQLYEQLHGEKFRQFPSIEAVLAYLKRCVIVAILQHLRKPVANELSDDHPQPARFETDLERQQLWQRVLFLMPTPDDRLLATLSFQQDFKPRDIAAQHPERWPEARDVSVALQRIMRTLRKDPELRMMLGHD